MPRSGLCERTPRAASRSPMIATSLIAGTLVSSYTPSARRLAAISLRTAFFAPGDADRALQRAEMTDRDLLGGLAGFSSQTRQYAPPVTGREHGWRVVRSWPAGGAHRRARHVAPRRHRPRTGRWRRPGSSRTPGRSWSTSASSATTVTGRRSRSKRPIATSLPWFGWLLALPIRWTIARRGHDPASDRPPRIGPRSWAPPDRLTPRQLSVVGLLAASSMASAFINTLFTQTVDFAADDFGIGDTGVGIAGAVVRAGIVFVLPDRRPRRPHRAARRHRRRRLRRAARRRRRRGGADVPDPRRHPDDRPAARARPRLPRRRRRRRGDAAQLAGVRDQRAGDGERTRRRESPSVSLPLADLGTGGWRLVYVVTLIWLLVAVSSGATAAGDGAFSAGTSSRRRSTAVASPCWPPSPCSATCSSPRRACSRTATSRTSAATRRR